MSDKENILVRTGKKIARFFLDLRIELKKVNWPDRKKLVQSTVTVLAICLIMAALVFVIDKILTVGLDAVNFYPEASSVAQSNAGTLSLPDDTTSSSTASSEVSSAASSQG